MLCNLPLWNSESKKSSAKSSKCCDTARTLYPEFFAVVNNCPHFSRLHMFVNDEHWFLLSTEIKKMYHFAK